MKFCPNSLKRFIDAILQCQALIDVFDRYAQFFIFCEVINSTLDCLAMFHWGHAIAYRLQVHSNSVVMTVEPGSLCVQSISHGDIYPPDVTDHYQCNALGSG